MTTMECCIEARTAAGPMTLTLPGPEWCDQVRLRVDAFLRGERPSFDDIPTPEGTPFQRACWDACRRIPYGQTRSYAWLAEQAGSPKAVRAAGQAMRRNPMPIVVPCHRVVGSSGWIGGFAGDACETGATVGMKRALLALESGDPR